MTPNTIKGAYLCLWLAIGAAVTYALILIGISFWSAVLAAYALFFVANGSLAYRYRARKMREQGDRPPSFLVFLFFPRGLRQTVLFPRPVRVAMGIAFLIGTAFFVTAATVVGMQAEFSQVKHAIQAVALILMLLAVGGSIGYVGLRLMFVADDEPLLGRKVPAVNSSP